MGQIHPVRHGLTRAALIALGLSTACASAGRQAAWEKEQSMDKAAADAAQATDLAGKGDAAWGNRDEESAVREAIAAWEAAAAADANDADVRVKLARAYYFLGDAHVSLQPHEDMAEALMPIYERGADWGEQALLILDPKFGAKMKSGEDFSDVVGQIPPEAVPAAYWYCTNLGRFAVQKGLSAKLFYKDRVAAAMTRVRELDQKFFYAGADRYFGAFYSALPSIAGRDLDKSAEHFKVANDLAPAYLPNKVVQAEFLAVQLDDQEMFEKLLNDVVAAPVGDDPDIAPENRAAQRQAKKKLGEVDDLF